MMKTLTPALMTALLLAAGAVSAQEVLRWTDEHGRVHYGDTVPAQYKRQSKPVEIRDTSPTDAQRQEAASRAKRLVDRAKPSAASEASAPAAPAAPATLSSAPSVPEAKLSCEEQWRRYDEAYACFNPYRTVNGGIRQEGIDKCPNVKQPDMCKKPIEFQPSPAPAP